MPGGTWDLPAEPVRGPMLSTSHSVRPEPDFGVLDFGVDPRDVVGITIAAAADMSEPSSGALVGCMGCESGRSGMLGGSSEMAAAGSSLAAAPETTAAAGGSPDVGALERTVSGWLMAATGDSGRSGDDAAVTSTALCTISCKDASAAATAACAAPPPLPTSAVGCCSAPSAGRTSPCGNTDAISSGCSSADGASALSG